MRKSLVVLSLIVLSGGIAAGYSPLPSEVFFERMNDTDSSITDWTDNGYTGNGNSLNYGVTGVSKNKGDWGTGEAIGFDGSSSHINVTEAGTNDDTSASISVWVNPDDLGDGEQIIATQIDGIAWGKGIRIDPSGNIEYHTYDGSSGHDAIIPSSQLSNKWIHIVGVYNKSSDSIKIYKDNQLIDTAATGGSTQALADFRIGSKGGSAPAYFDGQMDEVHVYNKAITNETINNLYELGTSKNISSAPNEKPVLSSEEPVSGSMSVNDSTGAGEWIEANTSIQVTDPDNSTLAWINLSYKNGTQFHSEYDVSNNTRVEAVIQELEPGQTIEWYAEASDGNTTVQTQVFNFTTAYSSPPRININSPTNSSVFFKRNVTVEYSTENATNVKYDISPEYTAGKYFNRSDVNPGSNQEIYVQPMPLNITNTVTVYANNSQDTVKDTVSIKNGLDNLRVVYVGDPSYLPKQGYKERENNRIKDLKDTYPKGWDFIVFGGDISQFSMNDGNKYYPEYENDTKQFTEFRSIYSRPNCFYCKRDRVLTIAGNHDFDTRLPSQDTNGQAGLGNYTEYIYRYYINPNADIREGSDGDSKTSLSYNVQVGNLNLLMIEQDSPTPNVYPHSGNSDGDTQYSDQVNSTRLFNQTVKNNQSGIIWAFAHQGVYDTVEMSSSRSTGNEMFDYVRSEWGLTGSSGTYQNLLKDYNLDFWISGHMHGQSPNLFKTEKYGTTDHLLSVNDKFLNGYTLSTIAEFEENNDTVHFEYRETDSSTGNGQFTPGNHYSYDPGRFNIQATHSFNTDSDTSNGTKNSPWLVETSSDWSKGTFDTAFTENGRLKLESIYPVDSDEYGFYRLNGSGTDVTDYSGAGNTGVAFGNPSFGASGVSYNGSNWDSGRTVMFDASDDYIELGDPNVNSNLTMSLWYYADDLSVDNSNNFASFIGGGFNGSHSQFEFQLKDDNDDGTYDSYDWKVYDGSNHGISAKGSPVAGEWVHLVAVYDSAADEYRLYENGRLEASASSSIGPNYYNPDMNWTVGAFNHTGGNYGSTNTQNERLWDGRLDEIHFYNEVVNGTQIDRLGSVNSKDPLSYFSSGGYESYVFSPGLKADWSTSTVSSNLPSDTNVELDYSENSSGNWIWYDTVSQVPDSNHLKFNISLSTAETKSTPELDNVNITFSNTSGDDTSPSTSNNATGGWHRQSSYLVELTASDSDNSVSNITYSVDGGSESTVSGSSTTVTISGDGNHTLTYYATDSNGNVESVNTEYVALDTVPPPFTVYSPENTTYKDQTDIPVKVSGNDSLSGISSWKLDGSSFTPNTSSTFTEGQHTVDVTAVDAAGNTRSKQVSFYVNVTLPDGYVQSLPLGKAVGLRNNPTLDLTQQENDVQGLQDLVFGNSQGSELAAQLRVNMSKSNISAENLEFDSSRSQREAYVHNTSSVANILRKTLLIPRVDDTGKVRICPGAESFSAVSVNCSSGFNVSSGETVNGVTVSEVTINGEEYYEATGINGTGGQEIGSTDSGSVGGSVGGVDDTTEYSGPFTWTLEALDTGFQDTVKVEKAPNSSFVQEIKVRNTGNNTVQVTVSCSASTQCNWIELSNESVTVEPGNSEIVEVSGTIPGDLKQNRFQAVIVFEDPSFSPDTVSSAGRQKVTFEFNTNPGLLAKLWNWITGLFSF